MSTMELIRVESTGEREILGFWDRDDGNGGTVGGIGPVTLKDYPKELAEHGRKLREIRQSLAMTMRDASAATGLRASDVSALELGMGLREAVPGEYERRLRAWSAKRGER